MFNKFSQKNEGRIQKSAAKSPVKHSRDFYEEEAKKDIENLLTSIKNRSFSGEEEDEFKSLNVPLSTKMMTRIDEVLKQTKSKNTKKNQNPRRSNAQNYFDNVRSGAMQNGPLNLRNPIINPDLDYSEAHNSQPLRLLNILANPNIGSVKSRISGGHNVNTMLRNEVNQVNIKPEVYPLYGESIKYEDYGSSGEDIMQSNDQYYTTNEIDLTKLINNLGTNNNNENFIRTVPVSENFDIKELLDQVHSERAEVILTPKESGNNFRLHDFLNKFYTQSANHLTPGNRLENDHFNDFHGNIESKNTDNSKTFFLSNVDKNPVTNERLREFMKYLDIGKDLKTSHNTWTYDSRPVCIHRPKSLI